MALGGEMHHDIGPELGEERAHGGHIANIKLSKMEMRALRHGLEIFEIARVSQLVEDANLMAEIADQVPHDGRTDESRAARDQKTLHDQNLVSGLPQTIREPRRAEARMAPAADLPEINLLDLCLKRSSE